MGKLYIVWDCLADCPLSEQLPEAEAEALCAELGGNVKGVYYFLAEADE